MMKNSDRNILLWGLTLCFAVLMSVPYIVPHTGFLALFGIVPLLMMERIASLSGTRRVWIFHYAGFLLWNAITTFWVCNATVGGGIFASGIALHLPCRHMDSMGKGIFRRRNLLAVACARKCLCGKHKDGAVV